MFFWFWRPRRKPWMSIHRTMKTQYMILTLRCQYHVHGKVGLSSLARRHRSLQITRIFFFHIPRRSSAPVPMVCKALAPVMSRRDEGWITSSMFRVIPGEMFLKYFASDRSHMVRKAYYLLRQCTELSRIRQWMEEIITHLRRPIHRFRDNLQLTVEWTITWCRTTSICTTGMILALMEKFMATKAL